MLSSEPGLIAAPSDPAKQGRFGDRMTGPTLALGISALYFLFALLWSAAGRDDAAFARAAAWVGGASGAATLVALLIAAQTTRARRSRWAWLSIAAGAACVAASAIASLVVVMSDNAVLWLPVPVQWLHALGGICTVAGVVLFARRRARISELIVPSVGLFVTLLPTVAIVTLALRAGLSGWPDAGHHLAITAAICTYVTALLILLSELASAPQRDADLPFGFALMTSAWLCATLAQTAGWWAGNLGMLALGRWVLPIALLGGAWSAAARIRGQGGSRYVSASVSPGWPRWRLSGGRIALAATVTLVVAAGIAAAAGQDVWADLLALAGVAAGLLFARQALVLQLARARVETLLMSTEELRRIANIDLLTGLPNRGALQKRLDEELERSTRYQQPLSVCFIDIDHFKQVNDSFGHTAGDVVLREVAEALRLTARSIDFVARYGGEEFVILAPGTWTADALILGERLRAQVEASIKPPMPSDAAEVTISVGVAGFPEHADSIVDLLARADAALYRSKRDGRNRVTLFQANWRDADGPVSPGSS